MHGGASNNYSSTQGYPPLYLRYELDRLLRRAQQPTEQTRMTRTRRAVLAAASSRHSFLILASTPALHDMQSQHSAAWLLLHVLQSVSGAAGPSFGIVQNVAFLYSYPQQVGGLQQPDYQKNGKPQLLVQTSLNQCEKQAIEFGGLLGHVIPKKILILIIIHLRVKIYFVMRKGVIVTTFLLQFLFFFSH